MVTTTIRSNEGDAHMHEAAFRAAADALEMSARISVDGCGCRLTMTASAIEAMMAATRKTTSLPADYIDEDGLGQTISQIKQAMGQAQGATDSGEPLLSYLTVHFNDGFQSMCQQAIDTLQSYIRALHEFDRQVSDLYRQLADDIIYDDITSGHAKKVCGNVKMAKFLDAAISKKDMASGKTQFGLQDMNSDMDAINIQNRIEQERKKGPYDAIAIANQYYQGIKSGKVNRADEFCAYYDPDESGNSDRGQKWLTANAQGVGTNSLGGLGIKITKHASGDSQKAAADAFNKQIDAERKQGNDIDVQ